MHSSLLRANVVGKQVVLTSLLPFPCNISFRFSCTAQTLDLPYQRFHTEVFGMCSSGGRVSKPVSLSGLPTLDLRIYIRKKPYVCSDSDMYLKAVFCLLGVLALKTNASRRDDTSPVVTTVQGALRGSVIKSRLGRSIYSFRGVRFAEPPVGNRRFQVRSTAN